MAINLDTPALGGHSSNQEVEIKSIYVRTNPHVHPAFGQAERFHNFDNEDIALLDQLSSATQKYAIISFLGGLGINAGLGRLTGGAIHRLSLWPRLLVRSVILLGIPGVIQYQQVWSGVNKFGQHMERKYNLKTRDEVHRIIAEIKKKNNLA